MLEERVVCGVDGSSVVEGVDTGTSGVVWSATAMEFLRRGTDFRSRRGLFWRGWRDGQRWRGGQREIVAAEPMKEVQRQSFVVRSDSRSGRGRGQGAVLTRVLNT